MNAVSLYRLANWFLVRNVPLLPTLLRNLIFLIFNSYIPPSAVIGRGTVFAYGAIGVVLHANARVGRSCVIGQGVTIGAAEAYFSPVVHKCPTIGDNCYLGAGARILGDIEIGEACQIGAGAVVVKSVPAHSIVVGVPGRIVGRTADDYQAIRP